MRTGGCGARLRFGRELVFDQAVRYREPGRDDLHPPRLDALHSIPLAPPNGEEVASHAFTTATNLSLCRGFGKRRGALEIRHRQGRSSHRCISVADGEETIRYL